MTTPDPEPTFVKKKELARRLSVSPRTIEDWTRKRMIPHLAVSSRLNLYNFDEVLAALHQHYRIDAASR